MNPWRDKPQKSEIENRTAKKGKGNIQGKHIIHPSIVTMMLITVDRLKEIPYAVVSNDDHVDVSEKATEESFAVGGAAKGNSILVTGREDENSYDMAGVMNNFHRREHEIRYYKELENTNTFILDKEMNISAFLVVTYCANFYPHYRQDCPNAKHQSRALYVTSAHLISYRVKLHKMYRN
jgi:hypothetical protein